jgi:hypothetical protein
MEFYSFIHTDYIFKNPDILLRIFAQEPLKLGIEVFMQHFRALKYRYIKYGCHIVRCLWVYSDDMHSSDSQEYLDYDMKYCTKELSDTSGVKVSENKTIGFLNWFDML